LIFDFTHSNCLRNRSCSMAEMFITFAVLATLATLAVSNVNQSSQRSAVQTEKVSIKVG